ncbi:MAG: alanine--tRNA ligase [Pseudomonadota bacterium]
MPTTNEIRRTFLDFFVDNGHEEVASSPLVPRNDPTLLFTNAGMVPFKNIFTGGETRPYNRAVTSQKCLRAGGKHNDLENVGYTARHNTFFEMLGNFSFGDYFKDDAISFAWNLVTEGYGLPADKLLVTVYSEDDDAAGLWKKIAGLSDDKIIRIPTSDNFWSMGDTGPCGPCSEIFFDHGPHIAGGPPGSPDEDGDRFIEIWNLVFMQFEQVTPDERVSLPKPSIDTGMGLERISAVLQGTHDSYETDLFRSLIEASAAATNSEPYGTHNVSHRVIADHLRATSFLIADGVLPSNEGRGYVLRRIMRRAMRHAHIIGAREPVIWRLVPSLVKQMGGAFGELIRAEALITETLKLEEGRFQETLDRGLKILGEETTKLADGATLPGDVAFRLYDTYGFPLDLTQDIMRGEGRAVDTDGFDAAMAEQKAKARGAWSGSGDAATGEVWLQLRERVGPTEFLGYETEQAEAVVTALVKEGTEVQAADAGDQVEFVVNQTPFYGESGGQVGDHGRATSADGLVLDITDVQKRAGDVWAHRATVVSGGPVEIGTELALFVDSVRRSAVRAHHSATHLLHEALRRRLGDHVTQKGSLVAPDRLRFDISQPVALTEDDLSIVEAEVNERIRENAQVTTRAMTPDAAIEEGAMALFGEKYGETVRVVGMGADGNRHYSLELCGGTHVDRTGDIGGVKVVSEGAVSAGVRRIEAVAGPAAVERAAQRDRLIEQTASLLNVPADDVPTRLQSLLDERRRMEREVADLRRKLASGAGSGGGGPVPKDVNGIKFDGRVVDGVSARDLKPMVDDIKANIGSGIVTLIAVNEGRASVVVGVTDDLTSDYDAVALVRTASEALGGKGGGGRRDMAQAGGPSAEASADALSAVEQAVLQAGTAG